MTYFSVHNHSHYSNLRLKDAISRPRELIEYANEVGLRGIVLSDHESISGHVKFIKAYQELKKAGKLNENFKIGLGNEIYLVKENSLEELKENYTNKEPDTQFYHFLLISLNPKGHEQIRELSSIAWSNSFKTGNMVRVPTFKKDLKRIVKGGNIVATSACLGGFIPQMILRWLKNEEENNEELVIYYKKQIHDFINFCIDVFGKDKFFLEIQPSENEEQHIVNKKLIKLSSVYGIDYIVATDAHYIKKEDRFAHKVYLKSSEGEREVDAFYDSTYIFSTEEIFKSMESHLTKEEIQTALDNTLKIYDMIEEYDLFQKTIIPHATIEDFELNHLFKPAYDKFEYMKKFAYSEYEIDRYFMYLIEEGFKEHFPANTLSKEYFYKIMDRINTELRELWLISERLGDRLSSYYVLTKEVVDTMWEEGDSIVGVARGSAAGYLVVHLLNISQINPLDYDLPHFRHLTAERPELPDIDLDSEQSKRMQILHALKNKYGEDRVLNIATFSTEGSRSALLSAARGMGIDVDEANYLTSLIPSERGSTWSLSDCYFGNGEDRKPIKELVDEVNKHEGLMEVSLKIENLIKNNSVHASGIYIFNDRYTKQNAMMKSSTGVETTQLDMEDSDALGGLKIDALTVSNMDKIRATMDMLIEDGYMEWQGSLRETYNKYLHPKVLEYDDPEMWKKVQQNDIPDLFQFDTQVGLQTAQKTKPTNVRELGAANNLMRLMPDSGIMPVDKYVIHKENPDKWDEEMNEYGLTENEKNIVREHLEKKFGVADSQEDIMLLSMDERIAGFSVVEANNLRKAVAKKKPEILEKVKKQFYKKGLERSSKNLLDYIWNTQIMPQAGYGFSELHSSAYSLIALQNMNLAHRYPQVYWNTACLTINSGANEESESDKGSQYGKVGVAISEMQQRGIVVAPPDINKSEFGFKPDAKTNTIIFGLKGIHGIGDDVAKTIIDNRPYSNFEDFLARMVDTKLIQNSQMLKLIKAGCFDSFGDRVEIMKKYIKHTFEPRTKLTLQSFNVVNNLGIIPSELQLQVRFYKYRQYIQRFVHGKSKDRRTKNRLFLLDDIATDFFYEHFSEDCVVDYQDGYPIIAEWLFEKEYEKLVQPLKDWFSKKSTLDLVNKALLENEWNKHASGTISEWEMSTLTYYYSGHELEHLNKEKYGVENFNELPQNPITVREYEYNGRKMQEYHICRIAGTVLDKNKDRSSIALLTTDGVVNVKYYRGAYGHYDKQISRLNPDGTKTVVEKSWFERGSKLLITGFRRGNQFVPRVYRNSIYQHTTQLIESIDEEGNLKLKSQRSQV